MNPMLNIAQKAARSASRTILQALDHLGAVEVTEKSKNDFVTEIDKRAEQELIFHIHKAYPKHKIIAEETGVTEGEDYTWIIDPLDGTANFIHGFSHFAISIGIAQHGEVIHGLIYDPIRDECFSASKGDGARLNNHRIRVSMQHDMERCFLATGQPFRSRHLFNTYFKTLETFSKQVSDVRRTGSAALDLAYVAAGRFDGYWEFDLAPWDLAAGTLIVKEAGGYVSDFNGEDKFLKSGNILAANTEIYARMLETLKELT